MRVRLKKNSFLVWAIIFSNVLLGGCATVYNPATQRNEIILINTEEEVALGRDLDRQIRKKFKVLQDLKRQGRLEEIGFRVANLSDRQDLRYSFNVIEDKDFNAFAIPGGYVYINSGLMDAANDNELACVLAHEIGHVAARHSVKKLQAAMGYQLLVGIALGISGQQAIGQATGIIFNLISLGYSRQDELLADKLAVKYAKKSGFDPFGMVTFFRKLQKEAEGKGGSLQIELFSSHPDLEERIKNVEKEIASSY